MSYPLQRPPEDVLRSVREVYQRGQSLDALAIAETFAPLKNWAGAEGCGLAAGIAVNTGAPRLACRLAIRAWREDRSHPVAQLYYGFEIMSRRGTVAYWLAQRDWPAPLDATADQKADLLALRGAAAAELRDFSVAERLLSQAEALAPEDSWTRLQRSRLLECQDKVEEALEIARAACALHPHPFYRAGVQTQAHLMQLLDRDDDAIRLLMEACAWLQNGPVAAQLYSILAENGRWKEAETALERYVALSPLLEMPLKEWVTSQWARTAYHLGKREEAARLAGSLDDEFHKAFSNRLQAPSELPERVQLEVTFVRQHFKTCAPATLAALGKYWKLPSEHLKLAEAMCYDGTPSWQQREWAENNGWVVREFRVTHESAIALISSGVPFAMATVEALSAHMLAVSGFDRARGTLLLRDPGQPYTVETPAEGFFKRYRPFGPHGMVFVPAAERSRLAGVALPDADVYDLRHQFWLALVKHRRERAAELVTEMQGHSTDHELVWEARLELAAYDANLREQILCLDKLLELFPGNPARLLRRLNCMRDAPRDERIQFLRQACAAEAADPALLVESARALQADARSWPEARDRMRRAFRRSPMASNTITALADLCWEEGKLDVAAELYRFAANLEGYRENLYQSWFIACRSTRRQQEALAHLEDRFCRFGKQSDQPALTLAWALREMEQPARAREVLAEAARLRPEDGSLLLRSSTLAAGLGETSQAEHLLQQAKGKVRESDWLRAAAELAECQPDTPTALRWCRQLLELEPLALDAHAGVARSLARLEGTAAAVEHLRKACEQFPHHYPLQRALVDWSRGLSPEAQEKAVRSLLRMDPADAWARRELALLLSSVNRGQEALREATLAAEIEPRHSYSFSILGVIHQRLLQPAEARHCFRRAVELSVDNSDAIYALLELARTDTERREELQFVESELIRQVVHGHGLLAFLEMARPVMDPGKLLASLRTAHNERPDLWHAWAALISQLRHLGKLDQAAEVAQQAMLRFPHLPLIWLESAAVHQWRGDADGEIRAFERAFEINPAWTRSALALTEALERHNRLEDARRVYERALQHLPQDPQIHAFHAYLLWRLREKEAAFMAVEKALRLAPGYDWPWNLLVEWAAACGEPERAVEFSRLLTRERPGEMRVWLMLARVLREPSALTERLGAVEKALELDAFSTEAWDLKAELLAGAERFDEAMKVCEEGAALCISNVHVLRGRQAWIEAKRRQFGEAIRLMRAVLAENSSYSWGWNQLAAWLLEQGATDEAAGAVEQLQRLNPHDSRIYQQLGFLRLKKQDQKGAREAFATALRLAPTDSFSAHHIFDLQLEAGDLEGAAATLRVMETHQPGVRSLAAKALLHLCKQDYAEAESDFAAICASPDPDAWPVDVVVDGFIRAERKFRAGKILRIAMKNPACNPQVGAALVRVRLAAGQVFRAVWQFLRFKPGELQRRAAAPLAHGLGKLRAGFSLRWLLWRRSDVLARDDEAWGHVGFALLTLSWRRQAIRWLSDWRSRSNVEPWMLFNLCVALRHHGRYEEATALARHVLERWGHREGSADMRLFLALEDALAGRVQEASDHLEKVVTRQDANYDQDLLALAKALVEFLQLPPSGRRTGFAGIRGKLEQRYPTTHLARVMQDVRRSFSRAGRVIVQNGGGWKARLWFGWRLHWHWLLLLPVVLAFVADPGLGVFLAVAAVAAVSFFSRRW